MIRILLLRLLSVVLIGYIVYILYTALFLKKRRQSMDKALKDLESTDYDKEEWKKIKDELEKK